MDYVSDSEMLAEAQTLRNSQLHEKDIQEFLGQFRIRIVAPTRPVFFPIRRRFLFRPLPVFFFSPYYRVFPFFPDQPVVVRPLYAWRFRVTFFVGGFGQCSDEVVRNDLSEAQAQLLMQALVNQWSAWPPPRPSTCQSMPWPPNCVRVEAYQNYTNSWRLWRAITLGPGPCP